MTNLKTRSKSSSKSSQSMNFHCNLIWGLEISCCQTGKLNSRSVGGLMHNLWGSKVTLSSSFMSAQEIELCCVVCLTSTCLMTVISCCNWKCVVLSSTRVSWFTQGGGQRHLIAKLTVIMHQELGCLKASRSHRRRRRREVRKVWRRVWRG